MILTLEGCIPQIESVLEAILLDAKAEIAEIDPDAQGLVELIEDLVMAGGKRLRPLLVCAGFRAAGGHLDLPIVRAAASVELFHTFALIHDDLMDDSNERRGVPSVHTRAAQLHAAAPRDFAVGAAILAGDLALALSDKAYWSSGLPEDALRRGWPYIDRMRLRLAAGQYLDILGDGRGDHGAIARSKTASYTTTGPLLIGAALFGAPQPVVESLESWGELVGEAYQLADDIVDQLDPSSIPRALALLEDARKRMQPLSDEQLHPETRIVLNRIETMLTNDLRNLAVTKAAPDEVNHNQATHNKEEDS